MEPGLADLVIIGAGWHGLAAAKSALALDPNANLLVLDSAASVGGVWAEERLYPELRTNNRLGSYEYGDFPMREAVPGLVQPGEHMSGRAMHEYLKAYAAHFGINDRIKFNSKVDSVEYCERDEKGVTEWVIKCTTKLDPGYEESGTIRTRKLILATGLTSQPRIPEFPGQQSFGAPLFHSKEFARYQEAIFGQPSNDNNPGDQHAHVRDNGESITVLGGSKSAWDTVYACAAKGHRVDWIIRPSGTGPAWVTPAAIFSPLNLLVESLPVVRALGWFSPCVWVSHPIRSFLHGTWLGCLIVRLFWASLQWDILRVNRYSDHEETAKLKPWFNPIWMGTAVSIINFPGDCFELIRRGRVKVHIADIEQLEPGTVVLSNGDRLSTRALILCTGWKVSPGIQFLPDGIEQTMGFPWATDPIDQEVVQKARNHIYTRLTMLQAGPERRTYHAKHAEGLAQTNDSVMHPFRLSRFMVPPGLWEDHSIAILGTVTTFNTSIVTEVQALWAIVYLHHGSQLHHPHPDRKSILSETALHTEFCALRSPVGHGVRTADFVFEVMPYLDLLLRDLGLRTTRKGSWWEDLFVPHQPGDYAGLVEEWKAQRAISRVGGKINAA